MSLSDERNWDDYFYGFCESFKYIEEDLTDPDRFPKDKRDKGGFWLPFRVYAVHGFFQCPVDSNCNWRSRDIQVDVLFRYNFAQKRGEVKIDREYLQRCGVHGGDMVRPLVGEVGGGSYVMAKTMGYIRRRFYDTTEDPRRRIRNVSSGSSCRTSSSSGDGSEVVSSGRSSVPLYKPVADHLQRNCEACMLGRCPRPTRTFLPDRQHFIAGHECNNPRNMDFIHWALLDSSGEPYYVM